MDGRPRLRDRYGQGEWIRLGRDAASRAGYRLRKSVRVSSGLSDNSDAQHLVFDLGAHLGTDTAYYLSRGFRVVAVEPNPELAKKLERLQSDDARLTIEAKALSDTPGAIRLHLPVEEAASCWATTSDAQVSMLRSAGVQTRGVEVGTISLDELVSRYGTPYYIKCDIEGSDDSFLNMLSNLDLKPPTVSFELTQVGLAAVSEQLSYLAACGYRAFYIRDQARLPAATFVDGRIHEIGGMWSGPFGVEIDDGSWLTLAQLRRRAFIFALRSRLFGEFGLAGRFRLYGLIRRLAQLPLLRTLFYTSWYDVHCFLEADGGSSGR